MDNKTAQLLIEKALDARKNSYVPYSRYSVGSALLINDGNIISGCNIENAAYGCVMCAERTAVFKAVSEGVKNFTAIAIVGGKEGEAPTTFAYPCGSCRQVLREFCNPSTFEVVVATSKDTYIVKTLGELLPESFGPDSLVN